MSTKLWKGEFGDNYHERNKITNKHLDAREKLWYAITSCMVHKVPKSFLEIGAGNGINIQAIQPIWPLKQIKYTALEPNKVACDNLIKLQLQNTDIVNGALPNSFSNLKMHDVVYTSGVLIHIPRENLKSVMQCIYELSNRYIVAIEYFAASETEQEYRKQDKALWLDDYGSLYMNLYPNLKILGYGFAWKKITGLDNLTWWCFEK